MAVVAGLFARLQAETSQFHARMTAAATQMEKMGSHSSIAARSVQQLRGSLQGIAMEAFGLSGRAGQAASSLLSLTGGLQALVAAAAAGGVAMLILKDAEALAKLTKEADAAAAAARRLAAARIGSPLLGRLAATEELQEQRDELQSQIDVRAARARAAFNLPDATVEDLAKFDTQLTEMLRKYAGLQAQMTEIARAPESALVDMRRQLQLIGLPLDEAARKQAEWKGLVGEAVEEYVRLAVAIDKGTRALQEAKLASAAFLEDLKSRALTGFEFQLGGLRRPQGFNVPGFNAPPTPPVRFLPRDPFAGISTHFGRGTTPAQPKPGFKVTPEFAIMSSMALLQGAQGGAAGLFGAAAGPLAMINPLAGAISAGIGGIFSLFDNSEEKRHRELLRAVEKLGEEVGLDRVTVVFTGPDGHQVRRSLAELEESDAVERVPGPAGATG